MTWYNSLLLSTTKYCKLSTPRAALVAGLLFLLLFFLQGLFFIRTNSQTYDEAIHLVSGYSYLAMKDFRLNPEHPPLIKELAALPLFLFYRLPFHPDPKRWHERDGYSIGYDFLYKSKLPADRLLFLGRLPNLFLGGVLIGLTGWWAYRFWGGRAAVLAIALGCLEPNLIAHSSLVTTDIGVTLFVFLAVYFFWEYVHLPTWRLLAATGIAMGLALVSKFSALLGLATLGVMVALLILMSRESYVFPSRKTSIALRQKVIEAASIFFLILVFAFVTILSVYLFQGFDLWLSGFRRLLDLTQDGRLAFFFGNYSYEGWWSYFIVSFLIKTPIGSLIFIAASLLLYRAGTPLGWREAIFLLLPPLIIFAATSQAKVNIGLRHILPAYPYLFVLASRLGTINFSRLWLKMSFIGLPVFLTAVSALRIAPHQLAYFNEFVGGADQGYRYLSDSNVDWGQDLKNLRTYMDKENLPIIYLSYFGTAPPSYYGIRYQYVPGAWPLEWPPPPDKVPDEAQRKILAISVTNLQDVANSYDPLFRWLWSRRPVAKIGYSIFIYDLTDDREGLAKLKETYIKTGVKLSP
jgi:dolichyl-phosphate-mannose-protein mannosyltransferase